MKLAKKKSFGVILIAVNLIVWGLIMQKVVSYFMSLVDEETVLIINEDQNTGIPLKERPKEMNEELEYKKLERNPFHVQKEQLSTTQLQDKPKVTQVQTEKEQINYCLKGIINNENNKLAIIENIITKSTFFLKDGEAIDGLKVRKIYSDKVEVVIKNNIKIFKIIK